MIAGVGPGSLMRDYEAVGIEFGERWKRLEDAIGAMRALLHPALGEHRGPFYATGSLTLEPRPTGVVPICLGSWGSEAGLRRVERLADGWLASAYNTTPTLFAEARTLLGRHLERGGRDPPQFPNALATTLLYLGENDTEAERMLTTTVAPAMNRAPEQLRDRILVCTRRQAVERIARYQEAGLQEMLVWPVADAVAQVRAFATEVLPRTCADGSGLREGALAAHRVHLAARKRVRDPTR